MFATDDSVFDRWEGAMLRGDFEAAWRETDRVERARIPGQPTPSNLLWTGQPLAGKRVIIRCVHGLGDTIQFVRYAPLLARICPEVWVQTQPRLTSIIRTLSGVKVIPWATPEPDWEVEIECMELPYAFRTVLSTIPNQTPYLGPVPIPQDWRHDEYLWKVGVVWESGEWDPRRSIPFDCLEPLWRIPGVAWFHLQYGPAWAQAARSPIRNRHAPSPGPIFDNAGAILGLDLLITVDTMLAHLAGALNRPVWTLLRSEADWRWMKDRSDSPWYPSMRLFRQVQEGDWASVVADLTCSLSDFVATSPSRPEPPRTPRSKRWL